jgi:hypothetical protein
MLGVSGSGVKFNKFIFDSVRWMNAFKNDLNTLGSIWQYIMKDKLSTFKKASDRRRVLRAALLSVDKWIATKSAKLVFREIIIEKSTIPFIGTSDFLESVKQCERDLIEDSFDIGGLSNSVLLKGVMVVNQDTMTFQTVTDSTPKFNISLQDYRHQWSNDQYIGSIVQFTHVEPLFPNEYVPIFRHVLDNDLYNQGKLDETAEAFFEKLKTPSKYDVAVRFRTNDTQYLGGPRILLQNPLFMVPKADVQYRFYPISIDTTQNVSYVNFYGEKNLWFRTDLLIGIQDVGTY